MTCPSYFQVRLIHLQISVDQWLASCLVTAQHRSDPRYELIERERLGEVVISTQVQGAYLIGDLVAGSEHNDRDIVVDPQATSDLESVKTGHGNIQEDKVWLMCPSSIQPGLTVHGGIHLEALIGEAPLDQWDEMRVVVHQKDARYRTWTSIMLLRG